MWLWHVLAWAPAVLVVGFALLALMATRRVPLVASSRPAVARIEGPKAAPVTVRVADPDAPGHARPRAPSMGRVFR
jgi:hypothetical protein